MVLFYFFALFVVVQSGQRFAGKGNERQHIEDGHQPDAHIAQIPHHGIGFQATHHQHDKGQHFIGCLPAPAVTKEVRHIGAGIEQDADEGGEAEQRQRDGNEHHAKAAQMVLRRCLQQIHAGQPSGDICGSQQHHKGRAAADDHRVEQDTQCLHKAHLHRIIAGGSRCRTGGRTAACLIGEQAALDTVHQHRAKAARGHLPQAEGFREDAAQHSGQLAEIYRTGRGGVKVRARWRYDKKENLIEIFEIPYSTSIEVILDKVAELVKAGKVKEISDMRDESDLSGLQLTIEL